MFLKCIKYLYTILKTIIDKIYVAFNLFSRVEKVLKSFFLLHFVLGKIFFNILLFVSLKNNKVIKQSLIINYTNY